ncbi:hypothetical protein AGDE_09082 [Angomonas deanei]|nr:hypothetical protein AGDE_09082 [Angomonas deanei]|eukprot:EPY31378.1 hypothetical protein AGDE_09082 [Angomonas deanei]
MRQDIRVQSIENGFSINVYELHARICLELGDIGEFNQCQSSLKHLYGTLRSDAKKHSCVDFFCFRLVYLSLSSQYDSLSTELIDYTNSYLDKRKQEMLPDGQTVSFTLRLCAACEEGDVRGIISLLAHFPVEMTFLLRIYLPKNRIVWLRNALCGVRGKVAMRRVLLSAGVLPICVKRDDGAAEVAWLDGSMVAAEKEFQSMCATLKLTLPKEFSFEKEVNEECPTFADSSELLTSVHNYLNYLTTRNDASLK